MCCPTVEEVNRRYVDSLRNQAIRGNVLLREEVETIGDLLRSDDGKTGILVTGEAGVGKSGVMFQVVENLVEAGMPVISFKADWLEPTHLPDDVGKQIGLAGSPARVLAAVAQGRQCVPCDRSDGRDKLGFRPAIPAFLSVSMKS